MPRRAPITDKEHAQEALRVAFTRNSTSARFKTVRCVLANFGDMLGLEMKDAHRVVAEYGKNHDRIGNKHDTKTMDRKVYKHLGATAE